jgi:hypothetical protein
MYPVSHDPVYVSVTECNPVILQNIYYFIMLRLQPVLRNDREISKYTRAVSRQQLVNTFQQQQTRTQQWCSNKLRVFSTWSMPRDYKRDEV